MAVNIHLMQHGACLSKELDPSRRLSPVGRDQIEASAMAVKRMGLWFDLILSSPKKRARETSAIVARTLGYPEESIGIGDLLAPMIPAENTVNWLTEFSDAQSVLIAGHLPNLEEVASFLLSSGPGLKIIFENGGLTCIECDRLPTRRARLGWHLRPAQLRMLSQG